MSASATSPTATNPTIAPPSGDFRPMRISRPMTIRITGHRESKAPTEALGITPIDPSSQITPTPIRTMGQNKLRYVLCSIINPFPLDLFFGRLLQHGSNHHAFDLRAAGAARRARYIGLLDPVAGRSTTADVESLSKYN